MTAQTKHELRATLLAARRNVASNVRASEAQSLCGHLGSLVRGTDTVCGYVPVGAEPGSIAMIDTLRELAARVLLPVARTAADGESLPLLWGEYAPGALIEGRFGLREPAEPWLPATAVGEASVILVPAVAVDRRGIRLGRGGGFYDRSLVLCDPAALLVAVVRDGELVEELPSELHDVRMTHALTPGLGLVELG